MGAGKRARQRTADDHTEQPDHQGEEPTVEVGQTLDEAPGERERLVALAEEVRKEAVRAYRRET